MLSTTRLVIACLLVMACILVVSISSSCHAAQRDDIFDSLSDFISLSDTMKGTSSGSSGSSSGSSKSSTSSSSKSTTSSTKTRSMTTTAATATKKAQDVIAASTKHVQSNAKKASTGYCARHVANAIDHALGTKHARPVSAKDFGSYLQANGYKAVTGPHQVGDVQVYGAIKGHPNGHMQMKTQNGYISDFKQRDQYAGKAYRESGVQPTNYRFGG
ncbi:hypothetical protein C9374_005307 [Naegleria lovaniensis]|uniref:Uncharacterized protein n=1 Tax=Naegleria lovaniensis TaxID=51637 RepID=A0AA88KIY9_NAELO|nr:uncharacterized protein C9374_005307 [Naegleria lovaniensis]KAG2382727.1 hypothetical protein C9374_005307 [Naegleria lovaniensis]